MGWRNTLLETQLVLLIQCLPMLCAGAYVGIGGMLGLVGGFLKNDALTGVIPDTAKRVRLTRNLVLTSIIPLLALAVLGMFVQMETTFILIVTCVTVLIPIVVLSALRRKTITLGEVRYIVRILIQAHLYR